MGALSGRHRVGTGLVIAVLLLTMTPSEVLARCDPGRADASMRRYYGVQRQAGGGQGLYNTLEARLENDGEDGYYPYIANDSDKTSARVEMHTARDEGEWYPAWMFAGITWGRTQGRPESSTINWHLTNEHGTAVLLDGSKRLGDHESAWGGLINPKVEIHTHSISAGEYVWIEVNDRSVNGPWVFASAPNAFLHGQIYVMIRNRGSQVPGHTGVDNFNAANALYEIDANWFTFTGSAFEDNSWGNAVAQSGGFYSYDTDC